MSRTTSPCCKKKKKKKKKIKKKVERYFKQICFLKNASRGSQKKIITYSYGNDI